MWEVKYKEKKKIKVKKKLNRSYQKFFYWIWLSILCSFIFCCFSISINLWKSLSLLLFAFERTISLFTFSSCFFHRSPLWFTFCYVFINIWEMKSFLHCICLVSPNIFRNVEFLLCCVLSHCELSFSLTFPS